MAVTQFRPSTDLFAPFFEDFIARPLLNGSRSGGLLRAPDADVVETEGEIHVMLEMPGMRTEHIEIGLENGVLTVVGEKRQERSEGDGKNTWHLSERRYGKFSRSFVLPRDVDADRIQAHFENGVLSISIPKSERARRRRIQIQAGSSRQSVDASTGA